MLLAVAPGFLGGAIAAYYLRTQGVVGTPVLAAFGVAGLASWGVSAYAIHLLFRAAWAFRVPLLLASLAGVLYWFYASPSTAAWRGPVTSGVVSLALLLAVLGGLGWAVRTVWRKSKLLSLAIVAGAAILYYATSR